MTEIPIDFWPLLWWIIKAGILLVLASGFLAVAIGLVREGVR